MTHIYEHFTFEQSEFKMNFVVMNQKGRQKAISPVERDFYKLLKILTLELTVEIVNRDNKSAS